MKKKPKKGYTPTLKEETRELISQGAFYRHKTVMKYIHDLVAADVKKVKTRL